MTEPGSPGWAEELARAGLYSDDPRVVAEAERDSGGLVRGNALAVARPRTAGEVRFLVSQAAERGFGLTPRGTAHSSGGQSVGAGTVVVDLTALDGPVEPADRAVVRCMAGTRWQRVTTECAAYGVAPVVTPHCAGQTVGGALSVGGPVFDAVEQLDVVTADGRLRRCGPGSDLYHAVLGGLGQFGVITAALVRVRAAQGAVGAPECARQGPGWPGGCGPVVGCFLPLPALRDFLALDPPDGHLLRCVPVDAARVAPPLAGSGEVVAVEVFLTDPDARDLRYLEEFNRRCFDAGGRRQLGGWLGSLSEEDWETQAGAADWAARKVEHDPRGLFRSQLLPHPGRLPEPRESLCAPPAQPPRPNPQPEPRPFAS